MTTKNIISIFAIVLCLAASKLKAQTVYITDGGKKYHAKNCAIVKTGKKGIELADAKKQNYEPCKSCKVEAEPVKTKEKTADKPKEIKVADKPKKS